MIGVVVADTGLMEQRDGIIEKYDFDQKGSYTVGKEEEVPERMEGGGIYRINSVQIPSTR